MFKEEVKNMMLSLVHTASKTMVYVPVVLSAVMETQLKDVVKATAPAVAVATKVPPALIIDPGNVPRAFNVYVFVSLL
jgi:hypothetical protein